jgi:hypothetical protein
MAERRRGMAEPETPVEPPEPPAPGEEEETPDEDVPEPTVPSEPEPEQAVVEPLLGLEEYVSVAALSTPAQAALKRWLQVTRHDMHGHYPLAQWQEYHTQMMAHTG